VFWDILSSFCEVLPAGYGAAAPRGLAGWARPKP